eukprot:snap_masked-scaffold_6-processed-gene-6.24-mRNA-1 protein AED:1.00 eAED:1.00 QI:0/0/0/0/1/1/3/0/62
MDIYGGISQNYAAFKEDFARRNILVIGLFAPRYDTELKIDSNYGPNKLFKHCTNTFMAEEIT